MDRKKGIIIGAILVLLGIGAWLTLMKSESILPRNPIVKTSPSLPNGEKPNILFILTDDQDLASLEYMPKLQKYLVDEGTSFSNYFDNYALCCVARASILRGQNANNTQIKGNNPPRGGFEKFYELGEDGEKSTIGTWLQNDGYNTAFIGKYLNGYGKTDKKKRADYADNPHLSKAYVPPGWDQWQATFTQEVYDYEMNENGKIVQYGNDPEDFKTDVLANKAIDYLQQRDGESDPFFMHLSILAPHSPATPAPRHASMFRDLSVPRTASFNEADVSDKPQWIQEQKPLSTKKIEDLDERYRNRLGSLQAVDDMIERIVQTLEKTGELDNTYIVFTSDNGFHLGQHGIDAGKQTLYEEDIHLPLIVRGPGVARGHAVDEIVGNIDLAPTFLDLVGDQSEPVEFDGRSFAGLVSKDFAMPKTWRNGYLIGFQIDDQFEEGLKEEEKGDEDFLVGKDITKKGYTGVRTKRYMYAEFLNGDKELYDLQNDPLELNNIARTADQKVLSSLQAMLKKLRTCAGDSCREAEEMTVPD